MKKNIHILSGKYSLPAVRQKVGEPAEKFRIRKMFGSGGFCLSYAGQIRPRHVRFGPFSSPEVRTNGRLLHVSPIGGAYYAYVAI